MPPRAALRHLPWIALFPLLAFAPPASALTICSGTCVEDPGTLPSVDPGEDPFDFVLALELTAGEDLSLGVTGRVYIYAPDTFEAHDIYLASALMLIDVPIASETTLALCNSCGVDGDEDLLATGDVYVAAPYALGDVHIAATGQMRVSSVPVTFVPEPATALLVGLGAAILGRLGRRTPRSRASSC
jgi:hypothetical protein